MTKAFIKKLVFVLSPLLVLAVLFVYLHLPEYYPPIPTSPNIVNDASTLNETTVSRIIQVRETQNVIEGIHYAIENGLEVSISGKKHTMGGHAFYSNAVVLDMSQFNNIESLDSKNRILTVQSGATWNDVQEFINPYNLAVIAMQGPNIFTIGGSISVNAHGWDKLSEQVASSVVWFDLALANEQIVRCSETENSELFRLAIGGFGLFGVILNVGLRVTTNSLYEPEYELMHYHEFPKYFRLSILEDSLVELFYADFSIASSSYLEELVVAKFVKSKTYPNQIIPLVREKNIIRDRFFIDLSRSYEWGKSLRWFLQNILVSKDKITRNNAMRSPFQRLLYYSSKNTDILQEYFIPVASFIEFTDSLRQIVRRNDANLINCTIRYINKGNYLTLNYAKNESFAFVLYFNVPKDSVGIKKDKDLTRQLVDVANMLGGTYYLTYLPHYDLDQIRIAYPEIDIFFERKKHFDPHGLFNNKFYNKYGMN